MNEESQQDSRVLAEKAIPLAEKAILLDSTYADAYATLALSLFFKHGNSDASDEAIKDANEAILLAEKALFYDPFNQNALMTLALVNLQKSINSQTVTSKVISARRALVDINNLKKHHYNHYNVDFIIVKKFNKQFSRIKCLNFIVPNSEQK